jgi:recombination protein RecA
LWGEGISSEGDILDLAIAEKLIQKSGAWFSMDGENLGQGRENTRQYLRDNPEVTAQLRDKILERKGVSWLKNSNGSPPPEGDEEPRGDDE